MKLRSRPLWSDLIHHDITYGAAMTATERWLDLELTTYTFYLTREGERWRVFYENFEDNWPRFNGTAL